MQQILIAILIFPVCTIGQVKNAEIVGTITGEYKNKIFLFFDNNIDQKDSISAPIKNGSFQFKLKTELPALCRLHFGDNSNVQELYIDSIKTFLKLSSALVSPEDSGNVEDARADFEILEVKGSKAERMIREFRKWSYLNTTMNLTDQKKHEQYFNKLEALVKQNPASKASAYLIAGRIYYLGDSFMLPGNLFLSKSEITQLMKLLNPSLKSTLEWKNLEETISQLKN